MSVGALEYRTAACVHVCMQTADCSVIPAGFRQHPTLATMLQFPPLLLLQLPMCAPVHCSSLLLSERQNTRKHLPSKAAVHHTSTPVLRGMKQSIRNADA